jgi:nicotinic acid mononucleotide adenylyltransferase
MLTVPQRRYAAAARLLDSPARMGAFAWQVERLRASAVGSVAWLAGRQRLAEASTVGLFAGTFNPVTLAHLAVVDQARTAARLEATVWLCAVASVEKEALARAALPDRLAQLIALARARGEAVALVNRGLYVDQVALLRGVLPAATRLHVIIGHDKLEQILDAHYYDDRDAALTALTEVASLAVVPRGTDGAAVVTRLLAHEAGAAWAEHIHPLTPIAPEVATLSATQARMAAEVNPLAPGLDALLPPEGLALVRETGAYDAADAAYAARTEAIRRLGEMAAGERKGYRSIREMLTRSC